MTWNTADIQLLLLHLPKAVHDLIHHEDPALVRQHLTRVHSKVLVSPAGLPVQPGPTVPDSSVISVDKSLDPMTQRSARNIGLLMHDYLNQLSSYDVSRAEGEDLLEHWRKIMLEQPERLSTTSVSHWHDERLKSYWQDTLAEHRARHGISLEDFVDDWDDWQRASGVGHATGNSLQLQAMNKKQWQDLVIRTRMHHKTMVPGDYC